MNPKVHQTILEIFQDRGYEVSANDITVGCKENKILKIYFIELIKIGIKNINDVIDDMELNNIQKSIIVCSGVLSSFGKQLLAGHSNIQLFHEDELSFNITHHELVPKHEIISKSECQIILKKYNVQMKQLPVITYTDPVSKYHGGCPGDLFKITRNTNDGMAITYRVCV
jgi:DNA-directed RNA polymerase I, II, and III subunit RPABC1